jgi:hypothetical protein
LVFGVESRKVDEGLEGKGTRRKRMFSCNGRNRSSRFAPTRKGADFLLWWFMVMKDMTFMNKASQITSFWEVGDFELGNELISFTLELPRQLQKVLKPSNHLIFDNKERNGN